MLLYCYYQTDAGFKHNGLFLTNWFETHTGARRFVAYAAQHIY